MLNNLLCRKPDPKSDVPTTERSKVQCLLTLMCRQIAGDDKKSASQNIRFIQTAISVVRSTHLKPYSCKFSKKIYTQHQLLILILFKDFRNQHYREFIEDIGDMEGVQEILDLSEVPLHYDSEISLSDKIALPSDYIPENREPVLFKG